MNKFSIKLIEYSRQLLFCCVLTLFGCNSTLQIKNEQSDSVAVLDMPVVMQERYSQALDMIKKEQYNKAESVLLALNNLYPNLTGPYLNLGIVCAKTDRLEQAESYFKSVIQRDGTKPEAFNWLGIVFREQGRFAEALDSYMNAVNADPGYANAHLNMGVLYDLYFQQPEQALEYYEKYLAIINQEDKQVNLWVNDLRRRVGRVER